jgi:hypothetical protein
MSIRNRLPSCTLWALSALALTLAPALAQVSQQASPQASAPAPSDAPAPMVKPASPAKKVAPKPAKSAELPAIGGTATKQKAGEEKPKVKRPFGELEGWSSAAEAEKKVMPKARDQSSSGYSKPPVGFDNKGNMGMGIGF